MRKRRVADTLFILLSCVLILVVLLRTTISEKESISHYENRYLAVFPEFTRETLLDGDFFPGLDAYLSDHSAFREPLSRLDVFADIHIIRRPVVNDIVVLDDLLLAYFPPEPTFDQRELDRQAGEITDDLYALNQLITEYGGQFLYVAVPDQTAFFWAEFPPYLNSRQGYIPQLEAFTRAMERRGLELLDMGELFYSQGNPCDFFSGVDHHFSFNGAFATYQAIVQRLNGQTYREIPILTEEDFIFITLPNPYVGSRGRMLWGVSPFTEHLTIAEPVAPVPFYRWDNEELRPGTVYQMPQGPEEDIYFSLYMGGDHAHTHIDTGRAHLPSILIFGDSFTNAVESLIYLNFNTMTSLDLRHFTEMSLAEFIRIHQPDFVVCIRDYGWLLEREGNGTLF